VTAYRDRLVTASGRAGRAAEEVCAAGPRPVRRDGPARGGIGRRGNPV